MTTIALIMLGWGTLLLESAIFNVSVTSAAASMIAGVLPTAPSSNGQFRAPGPSPFGGLPGAGAPPGGVQPL